MPENVGRGTMEVDFSANSLPCSVERALGVVFFAAKQEVLRIPGIEVVRIKRPGPIDQVFLCVDADKIASLSENNKIIVI